MLFTVKKFCESHSLSRDTFYKLRKRGEGPLITKIGRKTLISIEAAEAWRRRMEALSANHKPEVSAAGGG